MTEEAIAAQCSPFRGGPVFTQLADADKPRFPDEIEPAPRGDRRAASSDCLVCSYS